MPKKTKAQQRALVELRAKESAKRESLSAQKKEQRELSNVISTAKAAERRIHGVGHDAVRARMPNPGEGCLSRCVVQWVSTSLDPFKPSSACLPFPPCLASETLSVKVRGQVKAGTGGYGFVSLDPHHAVVSDNAVGIAPVQKSTSTYAGSIVTYENTNNVLGLNSDSPYITSQIGDVSNSTKIMYRVFAAGLKVFFIGERRLMGGEIWGYVSPDGATVNGLTFESFLANDAVQRYRVDTRDTVVVWTPREPADYEYQNTLSVGVPTMVIVFNPADLTQPFGFEAWVHAEIIGAPARGKINRMADPVGGYAAVDWLTNKASAAWQQVRDDPKRVITGLKGVYDVVSSFSSAGSMLSGVGLPVAPPHPAALGWRE